MIDAASLNAAVENVAGIDSGPIHRADGEVGMDKSCVVCVGKVECGINKCGVKC